MTAVQKRIVVYLTSLAAGLMDAGSGLLLICLPELALGCMGVHLPESGSMVFIRFIGAFVFSVGSLYLIGLWRVYIAEERMPLSVILGATAWVRLVVCVFTTFAIVSGALTPGWMTVPLTDGLLASLQIFFVMNGWIQEGGLE